MDSKFLTYDDPKLSQMDDFIVPAIWWSRHHEYYFASQFLDKDDIILDAACGVDHPFKFYASHRVKKCYAIDVDPNIKNLTNTDSLEFRCLNIVEIDKEFQSETFDKIFCISVLEHIPNLALTALNNFKKLIKPNGTIVITIDYPCITPKNFVDIVNQAGLKYVGKVDYSIPENAITMDGLKAYTAILQK